MSNTAILRKFHNLFDIPANEKLVNCKRNFIKIKVHFGKSKLFADYSCTYWKGNKPCQGKLYLSVNFLCFYAFIVGNQTCIKIRWTDILVRVEMLMLEFFLLSRVNFCVFLIDFLQNFIFCFFGLFYPFHNSNSNYSTNNINLCQKWHKKTYYFGENFPKTYYKK